MDEEQVLYQITLEDVISISEEKQISFSEVDINFIQDKIGDFIDWNGAIEFALEELESRNKSKQQ